MVKFIYYTDLHYGPDIPRHDAHDVDILGSYAARVHGAVLKYAEKEGIHTIIHGGDETTFDPDENKWLERATKANALVKQFNGHMIRVMGNHDYDEAPHILGLQPNSFLTKINGVLPTYVLQPSCRYNGQKWVYGYSDQAAKRLEVHKSEIEKHDTLILAGHWSFDRLERGYPTLYNKAGYAYQDRASSIKKQMKEFDLSHILTLHGHEHRFVFSETLATKTSAKITHLIMPSIVQHDVQVDGKPCGLFVVISDEGDKSGLRFDFKKVILPGATGVADIKNVTKDDMKAYARPVRLDPECRI